MPSYLRAIKDWKKDTERLRKPEPWHRQKISSFTRNNIAELKAKMGLPEQYSIVAPGLTDVASSPPEGCHTFFVDQVDMGLRLPLPSFIADLCHHFRISPSQLAPNSYSLLLSVAIVLKFLGFPVSITSLLGIVKINRKTKSKFYFSTVGVKEFVTGYPSSHKGWMSKFFFVRHLSEEENAWPCDMSWSESADPRSPPPPEGHRIREQLIERLGDIQFMIPELIKEDLLCYFGFSPRKVLLEEDLGTSF